MTQSRCFEISKCKNCLLAGFDNGISFVRNWNLDLIVNYQPFWKFKLNVFKLNFKFNCTFHIWLIVTWNTLSNRISQGSFLLVAVLFNFTTTTAATAPTTHNNLYKTQEIFVRNVIATNIMVYEQWTAYALWIRMCKLFWSYARRISHWNICFTNYDFGIFYALCLRWV